MTIKELIKTLKNEPIHTWFDLGLYVDRVREDTANIEPVSKAKSFEEFKRELVKGGVGFITYQYSVDGVTVEIQKYSQAIRNVIPGIPVHFIAGDFLPEADRFIDKSIKKCALPEIQGFDNWKLYDDFFFTKLERGSKEYNSLITKFWNEVLVIVDVLGGYIEKKNIGLLYLVNVCSNPGNVALSLACALISEHLRIPVINNNHDYYWEGGNKKIDILTKGLRPGPRDFFFTNSHIGEFFSLIEVLYPWESRLWMTVNINRNQTDHCINVNGQNPANVCEIGTAVDTDRYTTLTKRKKINAFLQVQSMLGGYKKNLEVKEPREVIKNLSYSANPVLIGNRTERSFDFVNSNIVFLQPTRLMPRKRIEVGFKLITRLFEDADFCAKFDSNPELKLTLLITGPIPLGQIEYAKKLVSLFAEILKQLPSSYRNRVFLGFLFSEFDKKRFKNKVENPVDIPELYNIASLITLPSETEGRGLPLIEATACGIPIFCRRYYPENVYAEVIGEHLEEKDRLQVLEFKRQNISDKLVKNVLGRVFFPQNYIGEVEHNKAVVQKRYSLQALQHNFDEILNRLYLQLGDNEAAQKLSIRLLKKYRSEINSESTAFSYLIKDQNRHYLPGFSRLAFMSYLKSLIDPSFFRVEEQQMRAMTMRFARKLVREDIRQNTLDPEQLQLFYNAVDSIFKYHRGEVKIRHDHSFAYRHRNNKYFPYTDFTMQELTGLVNMIYNQIAKPKGNTKFKISPHFFTDWNLALFQLTNSQHLAIDDRKRLVKALESNVPIAYFPGEYIKYEIEFFVLQPLRARMNLKIEEELTEDHILKNRKKLAAAYVFCQEKPLGKWFTADALEAYIAKTDDNELRLLFKYGLCKIVRTKQWSVGVHFGQLGEKALRVLGNIKDQNGFIITNGDNAPVMTDIVDLDRFHIGKVDEEREIISRLMGIKIGEGFVQFVPAGVRTTLAYPTPIQTAKDFSEALKGPAFNSLSKKIGEKKLFALMRKDAETNGTPIQSFLEDLQNRLNPSNVKLDAEFKYVTGVYDDGMPWNGVLAKVNNRSNKWKFAAISSGETTKKVTEIIHDFNRRFRKKASIAWNGGYILNPELVGKLGLPESYIGSPLGLLISNGKITCPPLFNKPAFLVYRDGRLSIQKVSCRNGIVVSGKNAKVGFDAANYNKDSKSASYYDLLHKNESISSKGKVIVRLAGNVIKEVIKGNNKEVNIIPVGLTLSIPKRDFPKHWEVGIELKFQLTQSKYDSVKWGDVLHAVEAGPMLIEDGIQCIDMKTEGWKTANSINTQAARLDFTDMRGPKIAVGLDSSGNILILTVNGRIRESVGATHHDMAKILQSYNVKNAMGFDPGGSSTLVMDGKALNISPYNRNYEEDIYSLPPEPRAVANAVIGWME